MNRPSKLAAEIAGTLVVASLLATSAFAESRHREGTQRDQSGTQTQAQTGADQHQWRGRLQRDAQSGQTYQQRDSQPAQNYQRERVDRGNRGTVQTPQVVQPAPQQQQFNNENRGYNRGSGSYDRADRNRGNNGDNRGYDRNRGNDNRNYDRNRGNDNRGYDRNRYDNRGYDRNRGYDNHGSSRGYGHYSYPSHGGREGMMMEGRIARINHERGGYRVWLDRGGYSYWVPEARFRLWPLRVGLSIRFGGWWNPLGYYDVYDMGPYNGPFYTSGDLHGIVENVDYYRGTVVLRDDVSGSFVTAVIRGGDPRLRDLRQGDYVDLAGAWTGSGYFDAYQLQDLRQGGYQYGYDGY